VDVLINTVNIHQAPSGRFCGCDLHTILQSAFFLRGTLSCPMSPQCGLTSISSVPVPVPTPVTIPPIPGTVSIPVRLTIPLFVAASIQVALLVNLILLQIDIHCFFTALSCRVFERLNAFSCKQVSEGTV
jgi:hypothetical protein